MTDAARIVPESELTPEQRAYAAERDALRRAHTSYAGGNVPTIEDMRRLVAASDEMKRNASAYTAQVERERKERERQAAAEKADRERQEAKAHAEVTKAEQRQIWAARGLDPDRFEAAWPQLEIEIARGGQSIDEQIKAKKRRELSY